MKYGLKNYEVVAQKAKRLRSRKDKESMFEFI
jgi:hypothetical protein